MPRALPRISDRRIVVTCLESSSFDYFRVCLLERHKFQEIRSAFRWKAFFIGMLFTVLRTP